MKRTPEGVDFTPAEQFVMMLANSHQGLRDVSQRRGEFGREKMPNLPRGTVWSASRLLNVFGDWKIPAEEITATCEWSRKENFRKKREKGLGQSESQKG